MGCTRGEMSAHAIGGLELRLKYVIHLRQQHVGGGQLWGGAQADKGGPEEGADVD